MWLKPDAYYDEASDTFDFDHATPSGNSVYRYLDQASGNTDRMLANVEQCDQSLMDLTAPATCRAVLKRASRGELRPRAVVRHAAADALLTS